MKPHTFIRITVCMAMACAFGPHLWSQAQAQRQQQETQEDQSSGSGGPPRKYYRWVDDKGITHYSRTPPPDDGGETEASRITRAEQSAGQRNSGISAQYSSDGRIIGRVRSDNPGRVTLPSLQDPQRCEAVRTLIQQLETYPRLRETDPATGEVRILSESDKQDRYQSAKQQEQAYCPN